MPQPDASQDFQAHILYAPIAVDTDCPFEDGPVDDRGISALLESKLFRVSVADDTHSIDGSVDIIVADCRASKMVLGQIAARFNDLRRQHGEAIFLILIEPELGWEARLHLKRYGTLCPIGERADLIIPRLKRLLDNLALADECGERLKTLSSMNRDVLEGSILETSETPMRVLVSGAPSPVTLRVMKSLTGDEFEVTAAMSVPQTVRYLEMNSFDCLLILPGDRTATYTGLIKMLRRNDRTRTTPILVIPERADETGSASSGRFMAQGADTVLYAPDTEKALMTEVTAHARRNRLTASMKKFLRKSASKDGTGINIVADLQFFEKHLERQCETSRDRGRPLCMSAFKMRYLSGRAVSAQAFQQALKYAQMIIRDTDLITAVRGDIFLIAQPGITRLEAERKQQNIAEVLQEIILDERDLTASEHLTLETSTVQYTADDTASQLLSKAFRTLRALPAKQKPEVPAEKPSLRIVQ